MVKSTAVEVGVVKFTVEAGLVKFTFEAGVVTVNLPLKQVW